MHSSSGQLEEERPVVLQKKLYYFFTWHRSVKAECKTAPYLETKNVNVILWVFRLAQFLRSKNKTTLCFLEWCRPLPKSYRGLSLSHFFISEVEMSPTIYPALRDNLRGNVNRQSKVGKKETKKKLSAAAGSYLGAASPKDAQTPPHER